MRIIICGGASDDFADDRSAGIATLSLMITVLVGGSKSDLGQLGWRKRIIGCAFRADGLALSRIGGGACAAKTFGWPGDARGGILQPNEFPACGGGMRRSFEHMLDPNRPSQPRMSDLPANYKMLRLCSSEGEVGQWHVTDG
jgi:hypothetical protein